MQGFNIPRSLTWRRIQYLDFTVMFTNRGYYLSAAFLQDYTVCELTGSIFYASQGAIHATQAIVRMRMAMGGGASASDAAADGAAEGGKSAAAAKDSKPEASAATSAEDLDPEKLRRMMEGTAL